MKEKIRTALFLFCILVSSTFAHLFDALEVRVAAFYPISSRFREIYGNVGPNYQIELRKDLGCCSNKDCCEECCCVQSCCQCYDFWVNVDWFPKSGNPIGSCGKTDIDILNVSTGFRCHYLFCSCFDWYLGLGPSFGWIWIENRLNCCEECEKKSEKSYSSKFAVGGIARAGVQWTFCDCSFLDLFVDYLYQPVSFKHRVDVGGVRAGLGIGIYF